MLGGNLTLYIILGIVAFLLVGFVVSYAVVNAIMYNKFYYRQKDGWMTAHALEDAHYDCCREEILHAAEEVGKLPYQTVTCTSSDGLTLSAQLHSIGSEKLVVFFHGVHAVPLNNFGVLAKDFIEDGYDVMFVEQSAHWNSQGKRISYGNTEGDDVLRWLERLADYPAKEIVLCGTSMGATAIMLASDKISDPRVKALISDCGFVSLDELKGSLLSSRHVPLWIVGAAFVCGKRFAKAKPALSAADSLARTKIPVIFLHGREDDVVQHEQSERCYEACASRKKIILVQGAGHATSTIIGGAAVRKEILNFVNGKGVEKWLTDL